MGQASEAQQLAASVATIIEQVREGGDAALAELTERFDGAAPAAIEVDPAALDAARAQVDAGFLAAFERMVDRVRDFHARALPRSWEATTPDGAQAGERWTPIDRVGLYVPGGQASYPSTVAMTAVPAAVAGVRDVVIATPPGKDGGLPDPCVLAAASVVGVRRVFQIGGAQAIAALAHGTESVPAVDKIFGPGNRFVEEAKRQLSGTVGIDLLAGPSELVVVADASADPEVVAADLAAQAEHDVSTRVTLVALGDGVAAAIRSALDRLAATEPRREIIEAAIACGGRFETAVDLDAAVAIVDEIAPEHLSLAVAEPDPLLDRIRHAGSIFVGAGTPVAAGDYGAGPNHVLPTGRTARFASALSTADFMKRQNVLRTDAAALARVGPDVVTLARSEGLFAHATSVERRLAAPAAPESDDGGAADPTVYEAPAWDAPVKLNQNETPHDVPDEVKDAVLARFRTIAWNRYPQRPQEELRAALAARHGVDPGCVLPGGGGNLLLRWAFEALIHDGIARADAGPHRVVAPTPSFGLYPIYAGLVGARVVSVPFAERWRYDVDAWCEAVARERPALGVLGAPNNPTGSDLPAADVLRIADALPDGAVLLVDEAYVEFSGRGDEVLERAVTRRDLLVLRTFSKAYGAAGVRLGYLAGHPDTIAWVERRVPPYHPDVFAATAGVVLLEHRALFEERTASLVEERDRLAAALGELDGLTVFPSSANFLLVEVLRRGKTGATKLAAQLAERGILVRKVDGRGDLFRVSAGTPGENDQLVAALGELLAD